MRVGAADRDSGLRTVSRITRWLVAGSVTAAGVLSAVVAQALPGNSGSVATPTPGSGTPSAAASPTTTTPTTTATASSPAVTDPPIQPAPPPVPTQRRAVTRSRGS
jgi:hypothetical protein